MFDDKNQIQKSNSKFQFEIIWGVMVLFFYFLLPLKLIFEIAIDFC